MAEWPPAVFWYLVQAVCGAGGLAVVSRRIWTGRRESAQWLAVAGLGAWTAAAALEAAWPIVRRVGVEHDLRHLLTNLLNVVVMLAVALLLTGLGIRERLRPVLVVAAIGAGLVIWWLPAHAAVVEPHVHTAWSFWPTMSLHLGFLAVTVVGLRDLDRSCRRCHWPLPTLMHFRLLQAVAAAGLIYTGAKVLLIVGVQAEWPGFSVAAAGQVLPVVLTGFGVLLLLALAPPDALAELAARIDLTEVRGFAIAFALQTKDDPVNGRDLGWRCDVVVLAEQVARVQGFRFDEQASLRLAAALVHTNLELQAPGESETRAGGRGGRDPGAATVHSVVGRAIWVPNETLEILREVTEAVPRTRAARVLKVVDQFAVAANRWGTSPSWSANTARGLEAVDRQFRGWDEVTALRRVLSRDEAP